MKAAQKRRSPRAGGLRESNYSTRRIVAPADAATQARFVVEIHGSRVTRWGAYQSRDEAEAIAKRLRQSCGFVVAVRDLEAPGEEPEHRSDRRRFLMFALMLGAVPADRVVERVLADLEAEDSR